MNTNERYMRGTVAHVGTTGAGLAVTMAIANRRMDHAKACFSETITTRIAGLHLQQMGRANQRRFVCAARARKLRRRGEAVGYHGRSSTGKARYVWVPKRGAPTLDHVPLWRANAGTAPSNTPDLAGVVGSRGYVWNPRTQDYDDVAPGTIINFPAPQVRHSS